MPDDRNANLSSQDQSGPATVYFDGSCPLCTFEINHYEKHTRPEDVSYVDISSENKDLGPGLTQHVAMKRFHVRLPDGSLLSGARAFAALWEKTPNWKWASKLAHVPGMLPLLEVLYRLFLLVRPALSGFARRFAARPVTRRP